MTVTYMRFNRKFPRVGRDGQRNVAIFRYILRINLSGLNVGAEGAVKIVGMPQWTMI